jgi:hypothetical protein
MPDEPLLRRVSMFHADEAALVGCEGTPHEDQGVWLGVAVPDTGPFCKDSNDKKTGGPDRTIFPTS